MRAAGTNASLVNGLREEPNVSNVPNLPHQNLNTAWYYMPCSLFVSGPSTNMKLPALSHGATGTQYWLTYRLAQTKHISAVTGTIT